MQGQREPWLIWSMWIKAAIILYFALVPFLLWILIKTLYLMFRDWNDMNTASIGLQILLIFLIVPFLTLAGLNFFALLRRAR
jgi:hypothetical protein